MDTIATLLFVEDEPKLANAVSQWLQENGYKVDIAPDGAVGRHMGTHIKYDLVLLDINLPYIDGFEVCRSIRQVYPHTPIIMLTASGSIDQKLIGFEAGADDYMVKPFDFRELLVRIKVLMKRKQAEQNAPVQESQEEVLQVADLLLNTAFKTVQRGGTPVALTAKEFALLEFLVRRKGRVASRYEIAEAVWDVNFDTGTNVVEVYINFLRKKVDKNFSTKLIHTKQGMGYYIKDL